MTKSFLFQCPVPPRTNRLLRCAFFCYRGWFFVLFVSGIEIWVVFFVLFSPFPPRFFLRLFFRLCFPLRLCVVPLCCVCVSVFVSRFVLPYLLPAWPRSFVSNRTDTHNFCSTRSFTCAPSPSLLLSCFISRGLYRSYSLLVLPTATNDDKGTDTHRFGPSYEHHHCCNASRHIHAIQH